MSVSRCLTNTSSGAREANLARFLSGANLQGVQMVRTNLIGADLQGCKVYGLSAWDLRFDEPRVKQQLIVRYRPSYSLRPNRDDDAAPPLT